MCWQSSCPRANFGINLLPFQFFQEFGADGEASRVRYEGFRQGIYCRVRIDGIPAEFIESFNPIMPLVIGGLTPQETERGLVRCRFKKHRWHKKILKCNGKATNLMISCYVVQS